MHTFIFLVLIKNINGGGSWNWWWAMSAYCFEGK